MSYSAFHVVSILNLNSEAKRREAQQWIDAGDNLSSNVAENAEKEKSFKAQDIYLILLKVFISQIPWRINPSVGVGNNLT